MITMLNRNLYTECTAVINGSQNLDTLPHALIMLLAEDIPFEVYTNDTLEIILKRVSDSLSREVSNIRPDLEGNLSNQYSELLALPKNTDIHQIIKKNQCLKKLNEAIIETNLKISIDDEEITLTIDHEAVLTRLPTAALHQ